LLAVMTKMRLTANDIVNHKRRNWPSVQLHYGAKRSVVVLAASTRPVTLLASLPTEMKKMAGNSVVSRG
jgi:hypothetical protein